MAKQGNLSSYFSFELSLIKEGIPLPFQVFLHLPLNQRLVRLFTGDGEPPHAERLASHKDKGITLVFGLMEERALFDAYFRAHATAEEKQKVRSQENGPEASSEAKQKAKDSDESVEERQVKDLDVEDPYGSDDEQADTSPVELSSEEKDKVSESLKGLASDSSEQRKKAAEEAQAVVQKALGIREEKEEAKVSLFDQLWAQSSASQIEGHSGHVSTFAVLFALGLGYSDRTLLKDLAFAGLIHDLGLCMISPDIARIPLQKRTPAHQAEFEKHVAYTLSLLNASGVAVSPRVLTFVGQHHEKFNGKGYPKKIKNWQIDAVTQIFSMADVFDAMMSGHFDGEKRDLTTAFKTLVKLEKSQVFPEYYNPDLFKRLVLWVESNTNQDLYESASQVVQETLQQKAS